MRSAEARYALGMLSPLPRKSIPGAPSPPGTTAANGLRGPVTDMACRPCFSRSFRDCCRYVRTCLDARRATCPDLAGLGGFRLPGRLSRSLQALTCPLRMPLFPVRTAGGMRANGLRTPATEAASEEMTRWRGFLPPRGCSARDAGRAPRCAPCLRLTWSGTTRVSSRRE